MKDLAFKWGGGIILCECSFNLSQNERHMPSRTPMSSPSQAAEEVTNLIVEYVKNKDQKILKIKCNSMRELI